MNRTGVAMPEAGRKTIAVVRILTKQGLEVAGAKRKIKNNNPTLRRKREGWGTGKENNAHSLPAASRLVAAAPRNDNA